MQLWFVNLMQPVFFSSEYYRLLDEISVKWWFEEIKIIAFWHFLQNLRLTSLTAKSVISFLTV